MTEEHVEQSELFEHHRIVVDRGQQTLRIDKYLVDRLADTSRTRIQQAAEAGNILVDGKPVKSNYKIKPEEEISIVLPHPPRKIELIPENIPLNILFEDEELLIVNKPAGMVVHPGISHYSGTLVNALYYHFQDLPLFQSGEIRPGLVHRIDKDTTGLLVVAKTEFALNHLANQFFHHTIQRKYQAIIWGIPADREGTIEGHIGRSVKDRKIMQVFKDGSLGKPAVTHFRVLEPLSYVCLVECILETGRTHQIRAHFESIRHPIFGDEDYGGNQILRGTTFTKYKQFVQNCFKILPRQALHAKSLGFVHPRSREEMIFDSELPEDMKMVLEKWRTYTEN
ncbi:MAG: RluA family pseudouridine synthase [Bacteroidales bacterium]|nr:RluA family pseudouridine synthase [Bacteroidales bacterium]